MKKINYIKQSYPFSPCSNSITSSGASLKTCRLDFQLRLSLASRSATKFRFLEIWLIFHCPSALMIRRTLLRTVIPESSKFKSDKTCTISRLSVKREIFLYPLLSKIRISSRMPQTSASNGEQYPRKRENPTIQFPS
ncbi:hypothetical protein V6Z11_A07G243100 [Gossypium hirsutum]